MASSPTATVVIQIPPSQANAAAPRATPKGTDEPLTVPMAAPSSSGTTATDKVMSSTANLAQLLPTGTVLAYQALSPSFNNHGNCTTSNRLLTAVLVGVLAAVSLFFSFTDSVVGRRNGKLYYGVATPHGFNVFNLSEEEEKQEWGELEKKKLRLRPLDYVHAFFTAVVFLTVAFSDVGLQRCFFPNAGVNTNELLKNLPLGTAVLSSFVFMIFPTRRKGIGYNDSSKQNNRQLT